MTNEIKKCFCRSVEFVDSPMEVIEPAVHRENVCTSLEKIKEDIRKDFALWANEHTSEPNQAVRYVKLEDIVNFFINDGK